MLAKKLIFSAARNIVMAEDWLWAVGTNDAGKRHWFLFRWGDVPGTGNGNRKQR